MVTTAAAGLAQVPTADLYDPDDVLPRNSPLLQPLRPTLQPSPSPDFSPASSCPSPGTSKSRRYKAGRSQGYAVLISHLDGHRRNTAAYAEIEPLTSETEDSDGSEPGQDSVSSDCGVSPSGHWAGGAGHREGSAKTGAGEPETERMAVDPPEQNKMDGRDLQSVAAEALGRLPAQAPVPRAAGRAEPLKEDHAVPSAMSVTYRPREPDSRPLSAASLPPSSHGESLPPIQSNSSRIETNGQTLPPIRVQLGDIPRPTSNPVVDNGLSAPPATTPRLPSLHAHFASPPQPPADTYRDSISPRHPLPPPSTGYHFQQANGSRRPQDYATAPAAPPGSEPSSSRAAASTADKMSIGGITAPPTGAYVCKFAGCKAPPFQTQYLLNSHANVHSSARPHYCPVPGCPRSVGGKGFKRRNEMIRHGLVHDSPGYACPFCPDRGHKYPRPDNLQR